MAEIVRGGFYVNGTNGVKLYLNFQFLLTKSAWDQLIMNKVVI